MKRWLTAFMLIVLLSQALPLNALAAIGHALTPEELAAAYALTGLNSDATGTRRNAVYHRGMKPNATWNAILIHYRARHGGTPAKILADVNDEMCEKNDAGMFVTVWMGILDNRDGMLVCANAGHENPMVRGSDGAFRLFEDKHGLAVGVMPGIRYRDYTLEMKPGDSIFVYTDGVPEANDEAEALYGLERLERALNHLDDTSPQGVLSGVRADVNAFVGSAKQFDDLTMLCMEYHGVLRV